MANLELRRMDFYRDYSNLSPIRKKLRRNFSEETSVVVFNRLAKTSGASLTDDQYTLKIVGSDRV
ncbi:MAG: hypothetical protein QW491_11030 [Thermoproteota archaeon]|nr:hypothetical protein [Candidatus Brockarchaeota archaeon]